MISQLKRWQLAACVLVVDATNLIYTGSARTRSGLFLMAGAAPLDSRAAGSPRQKAIPRTVPDSTPVPQGRKQIAKASGLSHRTHRAAGATFRGGRRVACNGVQARPKARSIVAWWAGSQRRQSRMHAWQARPDALLATSDDHPWIAAVAPWYIRPRRWGAGLRLSAL